MFSCKSKKEVAEVASQPAVEQTEGRRGTRGQRPGGERADRGDFEARQAQRQEQLYTQLGLSDAQKTKMEEIQSNTRSQTQAMRAEMRNGNADRTAMRAKMETIRNAELADIKQILTAEQFTKYETFIKERESRGGRGGRGGGGRGRGGN